MPVAAQPPSRLAALAALLLGCGPPAPLPAPPPPPPPTVAPASPAAMTEVVWGTYRSERFELQLLLPDGRSWRIDDHGGPWLTATHAATGSLLVARTWTEDGRANRQRCEERARLWRSLPDPARAEEVNARSIDAPAGFDTFVAVGVVAGKPDDPVSGFAVAFGGHGHRCFAWAYTTTARGAGAGVQLGERLAAMVERSLGRVVLESELTPRIPRERPDLR